MDLPYKLPPLQASLVLVHQVLALEDVFNLAAAEFQQLQGKRVERQVLPPVEDVLVVL
jgi:hypothetical protein